ILDTIKDKLHIEGSQGQSMRMISQLITESGGMNGLVQKFNTVGFGDKIKSWLSPGAKLPISSEEIQKVLGPSLLQSLATKFGMNTNQVSSEVATQLPKLVGKLSPDAEIPKVSDLKH
ncbi:MAG: YidB family protein, partial [Bacteriovorax sp.]|nr:YidB family protein [Bacteriovorax sp.]